MNGIASVDDDGNGYIDDLYGYNFVSYSCDPLDDNGHGTHVSGTIAAETDNGIGIAGIAMNTKIMAIKGLNHQGNGYGNKLYYPDLCF